MTMDGRLRVRDLQPIIQQQSGTEALARDAQSQRLSTLYIMLHKDGATERDAAAVCSYLRDNSGFVIDDCVSSDFVMFRGLKAPFAVPVSATLRHLVMLPAFVDRVAQSCIEQQIIVMQRVEEPWLGLGVDDLQLLHLRLARRGVKMYILHLEPRTALVMERVWHAGYRSIVSEHTIVPAEALCASDCRQEYRRVYLEMVARTIALLLVDEFHPAYARHYSEFFLVCAWLAQHGAPDLARDALFSLPSAGALTPGRVLFSNIELAAQMAHEAREQLARADLPANEAERAKARVDAYLQMFPEPPAGGMRSVEHMLPVFSVRSEVHDALSKAVARQKSFSALVYELREWAYYRCDALLRRRTPHHVVKLILFAEEPRAAHFFDNDAFWDEIYERAFARRALKAAPRR